MVVVIADDITGAAEMAGIALRYGLKTIVTDSPVAASHSDVLIIYTNTRSLKKKEAARIMAGLTKKAMQLKPSLFYKKTDSVLRGHILAEMKAQMKFLGCNKGLLVPVNPSLGRVISKGKYFIHGEPIHQTGFSKDPEFPISTSDVLGILGKEDVPVTVLANCLPHAAGIYVGEAKTDEDVLHWAKQVDQNTLAAGGASFFNALLSRDHRSIKEKKTTVKLSTPLLLISGTTFQKNVQRIRAHPQLVSYMPENIFRNKESKSDFEKWRGEVLEILSKYNKAIIAVDNSANQKADPNILREKKAEITALILEKLKMKEILIEGGSTAYSIIKKIGWRSFVPTEELQQGIVRMEVNDIKGLYLTIKPGSYEWPIEWDFN
ncbi:MAG: four-carbon acid sugar kinase family protein [Flavisolibacter sp.]